MKPTRIILISLIFFSTESAFCQWIQSKGSLREDVTAIAISGSSILAGTREAGAYLSTDSGTSWSKLGFSLDNNPIRAVAISDSNLIAATDKGLYLSTNKGGSWAKGVITGIFTLIVSGNNVFAGGDGLFVSSDNGVNWTQTGPSKVGIDAFALSGTTIYAGTSNGIYLSKDYGRTWTQTNFPSNGGVGLISSLAASGTNLFAVSYNSFFFRSTDNGYSWNQIDTGLINFNIKSLAVLDTNLFASTVTGIFQSTNFGKTWSLTSDSSKFSYATLGVLGSYLFAGASKGVFRSTNNAITWTQDNELPLNTGVSALAVLGKNIFAGISSNDPKAARGVFFSSDYGITWIPTNFNYENVIVLFVLDTIIFAGTDSGVFLSTDNGINWTKSLPRVTGFSFTSLDTILFAGTDSGIFLTTDKGKGWVQIVKAVSGLSLASSKSNLYAGTDKGVLVSIDGGKSWTQTGLENNAVQVIEIWGTFLFAGTTYDGIQLSTDNGINWKSADSGMGKVNVCTLIVWGTNIFAGTRDGVFLSTDTGRSWKNIGPFDDDIFSIAILGTELYVGSGSIWRRSLSELIPSAVKNQDPATNPFILEQNTPNPITTSTKISFSIQSSEAVSLSVYDLLGREVSRLARGELQPGTYSYSWDGTGFPNGEYYYRLQAGGYSETRKLILLK